MAQPEESVENESFTSIAECEELRKKIALSSSELIELTYHEEKFISKLDQLNRIACQMIEEDKYQHASVYLNEAERILQYAAGCGKTIERTVITTILNNQATLLQRTSEFVQSANYLEAIIYNINQFIEGCHSFELSPALNNPQSLEYSETATYLQRKLAVALYHLRFCALTSQNKTHEIALTSARKALSLLKEICKEEYQLEQFIQDIQSLNHIISAQSLLSETDASRKKMILKELTHLKNVTAQSASDFHLFLTKCLMNMISYNQRITGTQTTIQGHPSPFENYSIGSLMQASPQQLNLHPSPQNFIGQQLSTTGKLFKVVYLSMAHFTVATQLRFISANKYSLDEDQRKSCEEYKESRVNHLMSLILLARYLPSRSVFFQHALSSFRNHYNIDLLEKMDKIEEMEPISNFSITMEEEVNKSSKKSISQIEEVNTYEQYNKSIEIHQNQDDKGHDLAKNMFPPDHTSKMTQALMKQIHNEKVEQKKLKILKSKSKSKHITTSFSRVLESNKNLNMVTSKNKENKSKSKMLFSKGKQTIKSRRKELKTENDYEEDKKCIYYGPTSKSRSKSKKTIVERKNSKKGLMIKTGFAFQNKKVKNQTKIDQQYGIKSAGVFGDYSKPVKHKQIRQSQYPAYEEENIYLQKHSSPKQSIQPIKMKKLKSPARTSRHEPLSKRKSLAKDHHFQ